MRFPELYQKLTFVHGARVLLMPSAFAVRTGEAHWETLLRARAIETQCYVVAAAQFGQHNTDGNQRRSWGHAVAFDPWGKEVAAFGAEGEGVQLFEVDLDLVAETRRNMPMEAHRRYDVYGPPRDTAAARRAIEGLWCEQDKLRDEREELARMQEAAQEEIERIMQGVQAAGLEAIDEVVASTLGPVPRGKRTSERNHKTG